MVNKKGVDTGNEAVWEALIIEKSVMKQAAMECQNQSGWYLRGRSGTQESKEFRRK